MWQETVKSHGKNTVPQVVCLQGSHQFIMKVIERTISLVKRSLSWISVCPSEGRGESLMNKIGAALMGWKRVTHSSVGGVTRGKCLLVIYLWDENMIRSQVLGEP